MAWWNISRIRATPEGPKPWEPPQSPFGQNPFPPDPPQQAPAQPNPPVPNPILGIWRGSLALPGGIWYDEYVFQPNGVFSQQSQLNGGMITRTGMYSIMPGAQPNAGVIQLNTMQASNGILLQDGLNFSRTAAETLMLQPLSTGIWTAFRLAG